MSNYKQIEILKSIDKSLKLLNSKIDTIEMFIDRHDLTVDELEKLIIRKRNKNDL